MHSPRTSVSGSPKGGTLEAREDGRQGSRANLDSPDVRIARLERKRSERRLSDKVSTPLLSDLLGHLGAVPTIFVSLGFPFVVIGAFEELALTNMKLLFGFALIFFGLTWHYGSRDKVWRCHPPGFEWCDDHEADGRRHVHVEWGNLGSFLASLVFLLVLGAFCPGSVLCVKFLF